LFLALACVCVGRLSEAAGVEAGAGLRVRERGESAADEKGPQQPQQGRLRRCRHRARGTHPLVVLVVHGAWSACMVGCGPIRTELASRERRVVSTVERLLCTVA
jgi:hypothetical protein